MKKFSFILLISIVMGSILGIVFKESILIIKPFGTIFINLMFTIVVPLVFFTITSSIAKMVDLKKLKKIFIHTFLVFGITSIIAAIVMLFVLKIVNPVSTSIVLSSSEITKINVADKIVSMLTVTDFNQLFSKSNMFPLIIFSILLGITMSLTKDNKIKDFFNSLSSIFLKLINIIMIYAPIGLCAYFACLIAEYGLSIMGDYFKSIIIYLIVTVLYFLVFYTLYAYIARGKSGVKSFYKYILPSVITSFSTQSSLATLPVNIKVATDLNIDNDIKNISLSLGSTMHMEGSSIGSVLKIMFLFALYGIQMTFTDNIVMIVIALLSSIVMAGIPGGGLIGEMLIVSLYGLPNSAFLVIATIGLLIDPPATLLNATGDITSTMLIEKYIKK